MEPLQSPYRDLSEPVNRLIDKALIDPSNLNPKTKPKSPYIQNLQPQTLNSFRAFVQEAFDNAMTDLDSLDAEQCPKMQSNPRFRRLPP